MSEEAKVEEAKVEERPKEVSRDVEAGGKTYTIGKFKGYKAFRIGRMLTSLGEIGPQVSEKLNEFIAKYREQNVDKIPRATLEFRYPEDAAFVSEEAWKDSGGVIELANDPSQAEILAVVLPTAFELAGDKIFDLLAWVVADDVELEKKDDEGEEAVNEYIGGIRKELMFKAELDELFDLAGAAQEVLGDQLSGKAGQARSLLKLVGLDQPEEQAPAEEDGRKAASPEFEQGSKDETPSTPESQTTSPRPDSSTDSPPPTDGDDETSSTAPAGELSPSTSA